MEHFCQKIFCLFRYLTPVLRIKFNLLLEHSSENLFVVISFEGRITTKHDVQYYTKTPNVAGKIVVSFEYFWSDIIRGANNSVHHFEWVLFLNLPKTFREAKINKFYLTV